MFLKTSLALTLAVLLYSSCIYAQGVSIFPDAYDTRSRQTYQPAEPEPTAYSGLSDDGAFVPRSERRKQESAKRRAQKQPLAMTVEDAVRTISYMREQGAIFPYDIEDVLARSNNLEKTMFETMNNVKYDENKIKRNQDRIDQLVERSRIRVETETGFTPEEQDILMKKQALGLLPTHFKRPLPSITDI